MPFYSNGNCKVTILSDGTKIRTTEDDEWMPSFAESIDITITDKCDGNCPYCYAGCTSDKQHPDILTDDIRSFVTTLHPFTEVALNGNDMSHPQLVPFLKLLKKQQVIANITVSQKHFMKNYEMLVGLQERNLIKGVGISLLNSNDEHFLESAYNFKNAVLHTICGILTLKDIENLKKYASGIRLLLLGFKMNERGKEYYDSSSFVINKNIKDLPITEMFKMFKCVAFDNLALEQLDIKSKISEKMWNEIYMGDEGEFTYYLNLVDKTFAKSSMEPKENRFPMMTSGDLMFEYIRSLK